MEYLKSFFGDKPLTYDEFVKALEGSKDVKLANLASGQYVDKLKFDDLQAKFDGKDKEYQTAQDLIEQLKKDNGGNEALQGKISDYETKLSDLQAENQRIKVDSALKIALLEAKAADIDYLTFKIKEKGEVKLDNNGNVTGITDTIAALKTQFPTQFQSDSQKKIEENKLPDGDGKKDTDPQTLADALRLAYEGDK